MCLGVHVECVLMGLQRVSRCVHRVCLGAFTLKINYNVKITYLAVLDDTFPLLGEIHETACIVAGDATV